MRDDVPRAALAAVPPASRSFNPIALLAAASAKDRVASLLPIKYGRMSASPFAFFRGAAPLMAADLALLPNTKITAQLCGDAHVQNLGSFAAPDGKLVFDFNDFDETISGPFEWDVKRLAASLILAGRESGHRDTLCREAAETFVRSYCRAIDAFSREPVLDAARHQVHREQRVAPIHAALLQSQRARPADLLAKFTEVAAAGKRRFRNEPPLVRRITGKEARAVLDALPLYRKSLAPERRHLFDFFRPVDVGFKVVGTGSVGLRDYVVLLDGNGPRDPLFLQIKQEVCSAYSPFLPNARTPAHAGRRAAEGQRAIQPLSDLLLGWTTIGPHQYLVRQLNDHKGSIDINLLRGGGLKNLALVAGELLARGHARSGDACMIRGYCGSGEKMTRAVTDFAVAYADQTDADFASFIAAIKAGKIKAV